MRELLIGMIKCENNPLRRVELTRLLGYVLSYISEPILPQPGQLVLPGFESIMGFSVVA